MPCIMYKKKKLSRQISYESTCSLFFNIHTHIHTYTHTHTHNIYIQETAIGDFAYL